MRKTYVLARSSSGPTEFNIYAGFFSLLNTYDDGRPQDLK
jgi:hypothetical protein